LQYLIRWKGWSAEYDEWVHEGHLEHAGEVVEQYRSTHDMSVSQKASKVIAKRQRNNH
jgi:hypothetical protein